MKQKSFLSIAQNLLKPHFLFISPSHLTNVHVIFLWPFLCSVSLWIACELASCCQSSQLWAVSSILRVFETLSFETLLSMCILLCLSLVQLPFHVMFICNQKQSLRSHKHTDLVMELMYTKWHSKTPFIKTLGCYAFTSTPSLFVFMPLTFFPRTLLP